MAPITLHFAPVGSYLLVSETGGQAGEAATAPIYTDSVDAGATWNLELLDPNALTLDYCAYRIADGEWQDPVPHLKALEILRRAGTLEHFRITGTGVPFAVQYTFESGLSTGHDLTLVLERPDEFRISVNGTAVQHDPSDGYWVDTTFRRIPIGSLTRAGTNTIMLEGVTSLDMEIEACYVVGDFGVEQTVMDSGWLRPRHRHNQVISPIRVCPSMPAACGSASRCRSHTTAALPHWRSKGSMLPSPLRV